MIAGKAPWTYSPLCLLLITQGTVWTCQTRASAKRTSHAGITTPSVNAVPASPMAVVMATKTTLRRNSSVLSPVMGSPVSVMAFGGCVLGEKGAIINYIGITGINQDCLGPLAHMVT